MRREEKKIEKESNLEKLDLSRQGEENTRE
jgi:hypothetical protein